MARTRPCHADARIIKMLFFNHKKRTENAKRSLSFSVVDFWLMIAGRCLRVVSPCGLDARPLPRCRCEHKQRLSLGESSREAGERVFVRTPSPSPIGATVHSGEGFDCVCVYTGRRGRRPLPRCRCEHKQRLSLGGELPRSG